MDKDADVKVWVNDGKQSLHILKIQLKKYKAMGFKEGTLSANAESK